MNPDQTGIFEVECFKYCVWLASHDYASYSMDGA